MIYFCCSVSSFTTGIYGTMWKLFLVAAIGLVHIVATQEEEFQSIRCIRNTSGPRACAENDHNIECDEGQKIVVSSVEVLIGQQSLKGCDCTENITIVCIDNSDPDDWTKRCYGEQTCTIPERPLPNTGRKYFDDLEGCDTENDRPLHALQSRIAYMCGYDHRGEESGSKSTLVVIVAVVSSLVVLAIVLIVFAVVYMYKRRKNTKLELYRNRSMHDAQYHSNGGFDEDYNTIPADYEGRNSTREHKYYTITEPANGLVTANGKHVAETDDDYDKARHDRPALPSYTDRNAYSSNVQSVSETYNKILFNKPNNEDTHVDDYSHLSQQANDYSHLGGTKDNADPVSSDYNRLQEKAGSYDDALSPTKDDSGDETTAEGENIQTGESNEEPVEINTVDQITEKIDPVNSDAADSKDENLSEMNTESLQLPSKKTTDESGNSSIAGDCASLDSYESLPTEDTSQHIDTSRPRRDSYEIPDSKVDDNVADVDAKIDTDSVTDNASLDDTRMSENSVRSGDSLNS